MAFPVEASATGGGENTAVTTHVLNLPSGIVSGNLLVLVFHVVGNTTITTPTGWTSVLNTADTTTQRTAIFYRIADGTEGSTVSVTTSASVRCEYRSLRFTGAHGSTVPEASAAAYASSNAPDPPSLDPTGWGTEDTLWYAIEAGNDATKTVTTYPTNYTGGVQHTSTGGTPGQLALASRNLNAASADPGAFTLSSGGGSRTVGITLAIRPSPAAQTLIPTAIASTAALGSHTLKGITTLLPSSRASGLVLGSHVLRALNTLVPTARASSLQIGSPSINSLFKILPEGRKATQLVLDPFTDTSGVRLQDHIMSRGYIWEELQGEWEIFGFNRAHLAISAGDGQNTVVTEGYLADNIIMVEIVPPDLVGGGNMDSGLLANVIDNDNYWLVQLYSGGVVLYQRSGGGFTFVTSAGSPIVSGGGPAIVTVQTIDDTINVYADFALIMTHTGTPRTNKTSTKFGLRVHASDNGTTFNDFRIGLDTIGSPSLTGQYTLIPTARASTTSLGNPTVHPFNTLAPSSRNSTLALGNPTLSGAYTIIPNGIASTADLGEPLISSQVIDVLGPTGISSTKQLGGHTLHTFNTLQPSGRGSTLAFGGHTIKGLYTLGPVGKVSTLTIGSHSIKSMLLMVPNGVPSLASVVSPSISSVFVIRPTGKPSTIQFGLHRVSSPTILIPNGRPSTAVLGLPRIFQILFPDVCEPLALVIDRTTPTGLLIASDGLQTLQVVHVASVVLEVIKNDSELGINPSTISLLEVVCDGG